MGIKHIPLLAGSEAGAHTNPASCSRQMDSTGHTFSPHSTPRATSHVDPVNSNGQTQENSNGLSEMHVPPFLHGSGLHGSISTNKSKEAYKFAKFLYEKYSSHIFFR